MKPYFTKYLLLVLSIVALSSFTSSENKNIGEIKITSAEKELYKLVMEYRKSKGLPVIPLSKSLTFVAQTHCKDLANNSPSAKPACNMHSWSNKGSWSACCYTKDHKQASCMWDKPKELTNYQDTGYEISMGGSMTITAKLALDTWKTSQSHNDVIINKGMWKRYNWTSIGIGIYEGFSVIWFGNDTDPDGYIKI